MGVSAFIEDMAVNPFLGNGLLAGVLAALACGVMGPYVVARRQVFLAGAIAHVAIGGIGVAVWLRATAPDAAGGVRPLHGAIAAAILGAIVIGLAARHARERLDTLIGALWAVGMSAGILLLKLTPGYHVELTGWLFGNIAYVDAAMVRLAAVLVALILVAVIALHRPLLALVIDEAHAGRRGLPVAWLDLVLLVLVALAVTTLVQVTGLVLVLALLTLPAATAGHWVHRLVPIMLVACGLGAGLVTVPRVLVYELERVSPESAIVLAAGGVYLASVLARRVIERRRARRRRPADTPGSAPPA